MVGWKVNALLLLREYIEVAPKRHPLRVVMQERWDFRRRGAMGADELFLLILPGPSEYQV